VRSLLVMAVPHDLRERGSSQAMPGLAGLLTLQRKPWTRQVSDPVLLPCLCGAVFVSSSGAWVWPNMMVMVAVGCRKMNCSGILWEFTGKTGGSELLVFFAKSSSSGL
jgi:hypothetical protein